MRVRQPLPEELADKWRRLLAFQGGDSEALALVAVDLLWKKYGREVERDERAMARMEAQIKSVRTRLQAQGKKGKQ